MTPKARENLGKIVEGLRLCRDDLRMMGLSELALEVEIVALQVEIERLKP